MKNFILIILILCIGCSNRHDFEFNIIQNTILLHNKNNNDILNLVKYAVEESGNRKEDIIFVEQLNYLITLRDSLRIYNYYEKNASLEKHASLTTFLDTLSGSYKKHGLYEENAQNFDISYKLLDEFLNSNDEYDFYFTIIQISFLEANFFEECSRRIAIEYLEKF